MPHHLWSLENAETIGNAVGEKFIDVYKEYQDLTRLDMLRVNIRVVGHKRIFKPFTVTDRV